jgi:hypothetical protein
MRLRHPLRVIATAFVVAWASAACAQAPASKHTRVLFLGNSLTESGDIAARLAKLAEAMDRPATVEALTSRNYTLQDHWQDERTAAALRKGWDVVVLQQGASARDPERAQLMDYGRRLAKLARESGAKPAFFMVWPRSDRLPEFRDVIAAYREAAQATEGIVLPAGEAWLRALSADKRLRLYGDLTHPASLGSDLAVLTIYLALFPAGPTEFDEIFVSKVARVLEIPADRRDLLFDAATRAIDEPMALK